ncbi:MAG: ABC transporter substrate-binding protein [Comamonadaceae bacterium]|nr:MAG: ABC transporter substrate-binding protein [Comamonadaceae bacterium]
MLEMNRRRFIQIAAMATGAVASASALSGCTIGATADESLQINSFGGTFQDVAQRTVIDPFSAQSGKNVAVTTAVPIEALTRLRASPQNPPFDLMYMDLAVLYQAKNAGLLQPFDLSKVPNVSKLYPLAVDGERYWISELVSMTGIAYNTEKVKTPPTSWQDLWADTYRDRVALCNIGSTAGHQFLAMAARLNGGSEHNIDPGFAAIQRMKPNIRSIYKTPDEMSRLLSSGEAWLGPWYGDRAGALKVSGAPIDFVRPKEGAIAIISAMCLSSNTKKANLAHQLANFHISTEANGPFVAALGAGPTNSEVTLSEDVLANRYIPYGLDQVNALVNLDAQEMANQLPDWTTRWQQEIAN